MAVPIRFYRRRTLIPGLRVNVSKRGASFSVGRKGSWLTVGTRGRRVSLGIPGTGLGWYQEKRWQRLPALAIPARRAKPHVVVRIFAWTVIAALAALEAMVLAAHYH
jgi:hypothetical protein